MNALLKIAGALAMATALSLPSVAETTIVAPGQSTTGTYMDYMKTVYARATFAELLQVPLAIWLAVMLGKKIRGVVAFRLIFFLPYVLADVAAGLIWRFVYDGDYGLFAAIAGFLGVATPYVLADRDLAIYAVLAVVIWKYFGFHMMLFIAGLQSIDKSVMEAAEIDGATGWQKFRYVTLPLLGSTVRLSVFFAIIGSLQLFDLIMPLTGGGPSNSTQTMVTFLYTYGVTRMQVGLGSAVGVVLFVICVTIAFGYKRIFMRND